MSIWLLILRATLPSHASDLPLHQLIFTTYEKWARLKNSWYRENRITNNAGADAPRLIAPREIIQKAFNYIIKAREKVLGGAGCRWLSVNECRVGWFIKRKRLDMYLRGSPLRWKLQQPLLELFNEGGMSNVYAVRIIPITKWTSVQSNKCNQAQVIKIHGKTPFGAATIVSITVCAPMQGRGLLPVISSVLTDGRF